MSAASTMPTPRLTGPLPVSVTNPSLAKRLLAVLTPTQVNTLTAAQALAVYNHDVQTGSSHGSTLIPELVLGGAAIAAGGELFGAAGAVAGGEASAAGDAAAGEAAAGGGAASSAVSKAGGSAVSSVIRDAGATALVVGLEQWLASNVVKALVYVSLFVIGMGLIVYGANGLAVGNSRRPIPA